MEEIFLSFFPLNSLLSTLLGAMNRLFVCHYDNRGFCFAETHWQIPLFKYSILTTGGRRFCHSLEWVVRDGDRNG